MVLVAQRSTGSSLRSGSYSYSPAAFNLVGLRVLAEFPYNLKGVGLGARVLRFIKLKTLASLLCKGIFELSFGTELA